MVIGDDRLQRIGMADRDRQQDHQGNAGNHRAEKEIRRELRRVPSRGQTAGEIETDDAVHRYDHRRHDRRHDQVHGLVVMPLPRRAAPAECENAVEDLPEAGLRPVTHRRQIG